MEVLKPEKREKRKGNYAPGGARPGSGRKPSIEKIRKEIYDVTRAEFWAELANTKAVKVLKANMDLEVGDQALKAAIHVLDRALGRAKEKHEVTGEGGGPLQITWQK